jgi:micrococcal nuclease
VSLGRLPSLGSILLLIAGLAILLASRGDGEADPRADRRIPERVDALVVEVVDGDTARMRVAGHEESVRYIGIDTPESVIPGERPECFGKRSAALNRTLVEGEHVTLVLGAERRDHYGRLLAYVYLGDRLVNAEIIRRGFARTLAIAPNTNFADRFARLQQAAANAGRGLWGAC